MTREEILSHVDHTLLKPDATCADIEAEYADGRSFRHRHAWPL